MPYPPKNAFGQTEPGTALEPKVNPSVIGTGNADTVPGTANDPSQIGFAMAPYNAAAPAPDFTVSSVTLRYQVPGRSLSTDSVLPIKTDPSFSQVNLGSQTNAEYFEAVGTNLSSDVVVSVSGANVTVASQAYDSGTSAMRFTLSVASGAATGLRNIIFTRSGASVSVSNVIEVFTASYVPLVNDNEFETQALDASYEIIDPDPEGVSFVGFELDPCVGDGDTGAVFTGETVGFISFPLSGISSGAVAAKALLRTTNFEHLPATAGEGGTWPVEVTFGVQNIATASPGSDNNLPSNWTLATGAVPVNIADVESQPDKVEVDLTTSVAAVAALEGFDRERLNVRIRLSDPVWSEPGVPNSWWGFEGTGGAEELDTTTIFAKYRTCRLFVNWTGGQ